MSSPARLTFTGVLISTNLACLTGTDVDGDSVARTRAAVEAVLTEQAKAWNRGDIDGYMAGYANAPDLVFASGGKITKGWKPTYDGYVKRYGGNSGSSEMGTLTFHLDEITAVSGDAAVVVGRFELTETPKAGKGVFTLVLRRRAGGWRITHDHTSAAKTAKP